MRFQPELRKSMERLRKARIFIKQVRNGLQNVIQNDKVFIVIVIQRFLRMYCDDQNVVYNFKLVTVKCKLNVTHTSAKVTSWQ